MPNVRVTPPADGLRTTITVNGRTYTCALESTIDVPDHDARIMTANGWMAVASSVGTTAQRPPKPLRNATFCDTTLGYVIRFDGKVWRNPATGGQV